MLTRHALPSWQYELSGDRIVLLKNFDDGRTDYTGDLASEEIVTFVRSNQLPLLIRFTPEVRHGAATAAMPRAPRTADARGCRRPRASCSLRTSPSRPRC